RFCDELDRLWDLGREHVDDDVAEPVLPVLHADLFQLYQEVAIRAALIAKTRGRYHDEAMVQIGDWVRVLVPKLLPQPVGRAPDSRPVDGGWIDHAASATSAHTFIERKAAGPKVVIIATSSASRPRPIRTRPTRRALLRGSNVHQRPPSHTSIHAAKSIGSAAWDAEGRAGPGRRRPVAPPQHRGPARPGLRRRSCR